MAIWQPNFCDPRIKPQLGASLNAGHPLARGLVGCWLMNEGGGSHLNDSAMSFDGVVTSPQWTTRADGTSLRCDNTHYVTLSSTLHNQIDDALTLVWIGTPETLSSSIRTFFCGAYQADGLGYDWGIYLSKSYQVYVYVHTNVGTYNTGSTTVASVGNRFMAAMTIGNGELCVYINGILENSTAAVGSLTANYTPRLGGYWDTSYADMSTAYFSVINRALSASEIASLYADPYQMFRRQPIELWSAAANGGVAGLPIPVIQQHYRRLRGVA